MLTQSIDGLDVSLAFLVVVEDGLVHEGFVACHAVELAGRFIIAVILAVLLSAAFGRWLLTLAIDPADDRLPTEQASLVPLAVEHLNNWVVHLSLEVDQGLHALEKVTEVVLQV